MALNIIEHLGIDLRGELAKARERPRETLAQIKARMLLAKQGTAVSSRIRPG
jgi:hypothetical protein